MVSARHLAADLFRLISILVLSIVSNRSDIKDDKNIPDQHLAVYSILSPPCQDSSNIGEIIHYFFQYFI